MGRHKSRGLAPFSLMVSEDQVFENWLKSLSKEDSQAYFQDCQELASLMGLEGFPDGPWVEDEERYSAFYRLTHTIWELHQIGYPLPVLQSLREGKGLHA